MARTEVQSAARVFLGAALSPGVQAAARWIFVNALSRRAYALSGKDSGSPLLHWLAAGRPRCGDDAERYITAVRRLGVDDHINGARFLSWFRRINQGYPFLEYATDEGRKADARLMAAYAAKSAAPPPSTRWAGMRRRSLPGGRFLAVEGPLPPDAQLLAGWLRVAAGITHLRDLSTATIAHRTSPSGGARHPTDVGVRPGPAWPEDLARSWWYDPLHHALVASDWTLPSGNPRGEDDVVFAITSHVERAMWRYRDVRAFRPVLIDAGHVVETLMATIQSTGWTAIWYPAPGLIEVGDQLDPVIGYVTATRDARERQLRLEPWSPGSRSSGVALRTNPLVSLTATGDGVRGENHLASDCAADLTPAMVDALAYATPSARRDRPTTPECLSAATGLDSEGLDLLVSHGLLLDELDGDRLWLLSRPWFQHDWFLSLLAHAEEASGCTAPRRHRRAVATVATDLPRALDGRRTCRALTGAPLPHDAVDRVLDSAAQPSDHLRVVLLARHDSEALGAGMYLLEEGRWAASTLDPPTEDEVSAAAIGQPWARRFSVVVWLVPCPDTALGSWEDALVECGRAAQRITLAVSHDEAIGVFQSPALVDERLDDMLRGHGSPDGAYLVGIGMAADVQPERRSWFRPSAIYAAEATSA